MEIVIELIIIGFFRSLSHEALVLELEEGVFVIVRLMVQRVGV
jgi:hypothetical protein